MKLLLALFLAAAPCARAAFAVVNYLQSNKGSVQGGSSLVIGRARCPPPPCLPVPPPQFFRALAFRPTA